MSTGSPRISIILPTYNVEKYIDRCLASCVTQSLHNIEIIVVDDCGTDNSIQRAQYWAEQDARIRIVASPQNLGTYHARKTGVDYAKAPYIVFLDPDDELHPNAAKNISELANRYNPDVIFFDHQDVPRKKWWAARRKLPPRYLQGDEVAKNAVRPGMLFGTPGKAYSKAAVSAAYDALNISLGLRLTYAEDALLFFATVIRADSVATIPNKLYFYHHNSESATNNAVLSQLVAHSKQLDVVLYKIKEHFVSATTNSKEKSVECARRTIYNQLMADKLFILRHTNDDKGESVYRTCITKRILKHGKWRDTARLALFIGSLGYIRL